MPGICLTLEILLEFTLAVPSAYVAHTIQTMPIFLMQVLSLLGLMDYWCMTLGTYLKKPILWNLVFLFLEWTFCWFKSILYIANWGFTFITTESGPLYQKLQPSCDCVSLSEPALAALIHIHLCLGEGIWVLKPSGACFRNSCPVLYFCLYSDRLCICPLTQSFPCTSPIHSHSYNRKFTGLSFG